MAKKSFLERLGIIEPVPSEDSEISSQSASGIDESESPAEQIIHSGEDETPDEFFEEEEFEEMETNGAEDYYDYEYSEEDIFEDYEDGEELPDHTDALSHNQGIVPEDTSDEALKNEFDKLLSELDEKGDFEDVADSSGHAEISGISVGINYEENRFISVDEIYSMTNMTTDEYKSIFIADTFAKTLPDNIPSELKQSSVLSILGVSKINVESLVADGLGRVDALNDVLDNTEKATKAVIYKCESQIADLERRIAQLREAISARESFNEQQTSAIRYEVQRIMNIVDFIKPGK